MIWRDMVSRHLTIPHTFACVTDTPEGIDPSIEIIPLPHEFDDVVVPGWGPNKPQCLRRLAMFRPDAAEIFGQRFVSMDLDVVIGANIDSLFDTDADFKIYQSYPHPRRLYGGAMVLMTAGARPRVYSRFLPKRMAMASRRYIGSDQAWISYVLGPREETWTMADGVRWWPQKPDADARILFFHGPPKPEELVADDVNAWISRHYRANRRGRCLMLGYAPTVWDEAEAAIARYGSFPAVIASPEAAVHWPTPLAVANSDAQADRIAAMYGYEPIWCGRTEPYAERAAA